MARSRMLKPGFFTNEALAGLPPLTRLLFQGLWCIADKEGRLEDRPQRIKAEILPYDRCIPERMLTELHSVGFIDRYEVGGVRYIQISAFDKHQHPHPNEPKSAIPAPINGGSPHVNVTSPSDIVGSTRAESIAESESLTESLTDLPPKPPQGGADTSSLCERVRAGMTPTPCNSGVIGRMSPRTWCETCRIANSEVTA